MILKNFRHKKLQTLLIFLILMLCSLLMNASVSILISLDKPFEDFAKECESPAAVLYPYSSNEAESMSLGEEFARLKEVDRVEYTKYYYVSEEITFEGKKIEGFVKLREYNRAVHKKIRYIQGDNSLAESLKDDECILPACISNQNGIAVGDRIKIKRAEGDLFYTVKGIYSDPYNTSTAFDSDMLINKIPAFYDYKLNILLYGKGDTTGSEIEEAYRSTHDGQMNGEIQTLQSRIANGLLAGNIMGAVFLAIGIIMLFVSCLIINFMIRNAMITDAKTIAVYKTMGYTTGDILEMYLSFYLAVVTIACLTGTVGSVFISNSILGSAFENMGQVAANNVFLPGIMCYILITGLVTGLIYLIIGKTRKVKPVYALNGMTSTGTKKKKRYKGSSKIQFSAIGIALRTITRNKKGIIGVLLTSVITIFSVNFAIISLDVANSLKNNNDYWLGVDKSDVMIGVSDPAQYETVQKAIEEDSRVNRYLRNRLGNRITMKWKKGMNATAMEAFVYDDFIEADLPVIKGRNPRTSDEIAISSKVSKDLSKDVGDYLEVYLDGKKRVDLLITGVFQTFFQLGDSCRVTSDLYKENKYDFEYDNFSIYLKNKTDMDAFIKDIKQKIGGSGNAIERTEAFSSIMDMIATPQKKAIPPVVALVLLVGGINIFCIVMLKNANSEKTNGIYKCIGYSTGHLIFSNLYYVGMAAVVSTAVAVPMVIVFYPGIMRLCLAMFGFQKYPVSYNILHITLANLGMLALFTASTLISSRSLKKVNVRDLVQE